FMTPLSCSEDNRTGRGASAAAARGRVDAAQGKRACRSRSSACPGENFGQPAQRKETIHPAKPRRPRLRRPARRYNPQTPPTPPPLARAGRFFLKGGRHGEAPGARGRGGAGKRGEPVRPGKHGGNAGKAPYPLREKLDFALGGVTGINGTPWDTPPSEVASW